jgi:hypothetical protein
MKALFAATLCGIVTIAVPTATNADAEACRTALTQFNSAQAAVATQVTPYSDCIADSDGREGCQSSFAKLQSAQSTFEAAVSEYQRDCGSN